MLRNGHRGDLRVPPNGNEAFTLAEVLVVMGLLTILIIGSFGAICSARLISDRAADYIAGTALAQAKINDIRATDYPSAAFSPTTATTNISTNSVALNSTGTTFLVPATVTSIIQPITWGHLVTVTVVVNEPNRSMTNSLQTVVNSYSGGRGQ